MCTCLCEDLRGAYRLLREDHERLRSDVIILVNLLRAKGVLDVAGVAHADCELPPGVPAASVTLQDVPSPVRAGGRNAAEAAMPGGVATTNNTAAAEDRAERRVHPGSKGVACTWDQYLRYCVGDHREAEKLWRESSPVEEPVTHDDGDVVGRREPQLDEAAAQGSADDSARSSWQAEASPQLRQHALAAGSGFCGGCGVPSGQSSQGQSGGSVVPVPGSGGPVSSGFGGDDYRGDDPYGGGGGGCGGFAGATRRTHLALDAIRHRLTAQDGGSAVRVGKNLWTRMTPRSFLEAKLKQKSCFMGHDWRFQGWWDERKDPQKWPVA